MHDVAEAVSPHQMVEVRGVTGAPDFAPEVDHPILHVLGKARFPVARRVTFERLASTQEDSQWVEVDGIIRTASVAGGTLSLEVAIEGGRVRARVPHVPWEAWRGLVDARAVIRGACGTLFNPKNQLVGVRLNVPSLEEVHVTEASPADPYALPMRPVANLLRFTPQAGLGHRIRVRGVVLLHRPGRWLFIHDQTQGLFIPTPAQAPDLPRGDIVDVVGFPAVGNYTPVLEDATVRRVGPGALPAPRAVSAREALGGAFDTELVTLEGRLVERLRADEGQVLVLQAGDTVFEARLAEGAAGAALDSIRDGSKLQVTGICSVDVDRSRIPRSFQVILYSPTDIVVLSRPSWWTVQRTISGVALLALLVLGAVAWAILLRRRVREQTEIIRRRLESEGALKRRYQDLIDNANDMIFVLDLQGRFRSFNKAAERVLGYRRQEVLGREVASFLASDASPRVLAALHLAAQGEGRPTDEWIMLSKDGRRVPLEVSLRVIEETRTPVGMQGIARDITERRLAEETLRSAKDAAEAASRAKSEFLANMSHEIRTPMNGIIGMTELTLDTELTVDQRQYLDMVKSSADSLLVVINDVLDLSKIEAGKLDLDPVAFNLQECLAECLKPMAFRADQKGLELTCDVHPEVPREIFADPIRLRQVVINLMGNAIKFTDRGEVGLEVSVESPEDEGIRLRLAVRDTGIGIAPEKQRIIFEAFSQADNSAARKFGGTGLGLTISSRLIEMMGGRIGVQSALGRGSCFTCVVPVGIPKSAAVQEAFETPELTGLSALVVDDNATSRRILAATLRQCGMLPALAESGREALTLLERVETSGSPFTLLLVDLHMPGMSGFELVESTRKFLDVRKTNIIMLSSAGQRGDAARCRQLGIAGTLTKPIVPSELRTAILKVLGPKEPQAAPPPAVTRDSVEENTRRLRILLAEDNPVNQMLAVRFLEKRGYSVVVAGNGREAVERLAGGRFDLVIMDVQMPEMDGFEAAREIRAGETRTGAHVPIIAVTAHAMHGDRERCLAAGMDGYISKPLRVEELFAEIDAHVSPTAP
jgi:PAS domain S-box-containing protein